MSDEAKGRLAEVVVERLARHLDGPELPVNYEVEQALLSALLVDNALMDEAGGVLKPEHFAEPVHGRIFDVIVDG